MRKKLFAAILIVFLGFSSLSAESKPYKNSRVIAQAAPPQSGTMAMPVNPKQIGVKTIGDYRVVIMAESAKGWYQWENNQLVWSCPASNTNLHLEAELRDIRDNRILPYSDVTMSIYRGKTLIESKQLVFLWAPMGYHYGGNFTIPKSDTYNVKVDFSAPKFARHSKALGNRMNLPGSVTFTNLRLSPMGQTAD